MWWMRMRLLFGFVVLLALGHLPQERGVLAQKYYMNFAFNNNNPDMEASDGGKVGPPKDGHATDGPGHDGDNGHTGGTDNGTGTGGGDADDSMNDSEDANENAGEKEAAGKDGANYEANQGHDNENGNGNGNANTAQQPTGGRDDDNDDSDSKDPKDRRRKLAEQEDKPLKQRDHSHHSSYEISIDDSFGGRYVRSIYESSESHGHSGSKAGSNERDSGAQEGKDQAPKDNDNTKNKEDLGTPGAVGVEVPDATEGVGIARDGNNDYEEM